MALIVVQLHIHRGRQLQKYQLGQKKNVVGRRKNKIKGKKGFLIYNKVVGEADGGKGN